VATDFGDGSVAYATALQGKVVAAGTTGPGDLAAAKLPSSPWRVIYPIGVRCFGVGEKLISDFGWNGVLAIGLCRTASTSTLAPQRSARGAFGLARSFPDSNLDPAFGVTGPVTTDFGEATSPLARVHASLVAPFPRIS
jgi:hypothetical protein